MTLFYSALDAWLAEGSAGAGGNVIGHPFAGSNPYSPTAGAENDPRGKPDAGLHSAQAQGNRRPK